MMGRTAETLGGVMVLALVAAAITEATLAVGHRESLGSEELLRQLHGGFKKTGPVATVSPTPTTTPSPTPSPIASPTSPPKVPTVTTSSFVRLRAGASTSTAVLAELNGGTVLERLPDGNSQWQQVRYGNMVGYVFKAYLIY